MQDICLVVEEKGQWWCKFSSCSSFVLPICQFFCPSLADLSLPNWTVHLPKSCFFLELTLQTPFWLSHLVLLIFLLLCISVCLKWVLLLSVVIIWIWLSSLLSQQSIWNTGCNLFCQQQPCLVDVLIFLMSPPSQWENQHFTASLPLFHWHICFWVCLDYCPDVSHLPVFRNVTFWWFIFDDSFPTMCPIGVTRCVLEAVLWFPSFIWGNEATKQLQSIFAATMLQFQRDNPVLSEIFSLY